MSNKISKSDIGKLVYIRKDLRNFYKSALRLNKCTGILKNISTIYASVLFDDRPRTVYLDDLEMPKNETPKNEQLLFSFMEQYNDN